jgi:hypothetical protein
LFDGGQLRVLLALEYAGVVASLLIRQGISAAMGRVLAGHAALMWVWCRHGARCGGCMVQGRGEGEGEAGRGGQSCEPDANQGRTKRTQIWVFLGRFSGSAGSFLNAEERLFGTVGFRMGDRLTVSSSPETLQIPIREGNHIYVMGSIARIYVLEKSIHIYVAEKHKAYRI